MIEIQDREHEARYKHRWYGKYRAFVRDNNDPERLGRCRLEVPAVLGQGRQSWSDWAWPCFPYGGNEDTGMFLIPEEGASVWAEFEGGHVQYPIWAGVWLAGSNPGEQPEESKRLCDEPTCHDCEDKVEHKADRHDDLEHKKYHGHPPYSCPRRKVLLKTETGHTFVVDDTRRGGVSQTAAAIALATSRMRVSSGLADIRHRQPAIVHPGRSAEWLNLTSPAPRLLDLVREPYGGPYEWRAVSTRVNSAGNDDPDILAPMSEESLS